ncbi:MAG: peptidase domain-containing ABC transporter [Muribaculaceae bacterium]|nr:peptidase domain-containing ABC transporter [Muribaculaceae bacterium]
MGRFKLIRQLDSMHCGVASLAMVCRHHGLNCSQQWLESRCFPTREGVSLMALTDAARDVGFNTVSARVSIDRMADAPLPCILHWNQNHFVVLYRVSRGGKRFHIADPGKGKYTCSREEMQRHWATTRSNGEDKGIAMFFEPTEDFGKVREEHSRRPLSLGFLWKYIGKFRAHFFHIFLGLLLGCVLQLVLPFLTQAIVDVGITHRDIGFIWLVLLGELLIVTGRTVTDFIRRWLLLHISMRVNVSLVSDFFRKLVRLPMSFFDNRLIGDLLQRISDHGRVQSFLTQQLLGMIFTCLSFLIFGVVLLVYNRLIFLIFMAGSIIYGFWIAAFLRRRKVLDYAIFEVQAKNQSRTYGFVTCMQEIKLQNCEQRRREEWEDTQAELFEAQMRSMKLQQTQEAGSIFINEVKNIIITVLAATAVIQGEMTLGAMLAVQYIIGQLNSPVEQFMAFIYSMQDVKISLERISEIHCGRDEDATCGTLCALPDDAGIELRGVGFKYDPHSRRHTLHDIDMVIPHGKVTAIVGASGSGKTTLIKLLLGYYAPLEGEITLGGRGLTDYDVEWWRGRCGAVMQEGVIFSDTIARNIATGEGEIDRERLAYAARMANIHDHIMQLPLKYNTQIGSEGKGLSLGQKQRLLIARAIYRDPSFILLDEATNSLDAANERAIVENLAEFYRGRTVVVVAHRLSTVRDADQIIVMEEGTIVERGDHTSLIAARGAYYNLVKNQLELGT